MFRMLWGAWLVANVCMWMNDVAAAWLMTSLSASPVMVALVQTASTLPVFLLGLPSGALADILDRRLWFIGTQVWVAAVGLLIAAVVITDAMSAPLLLALTFANGIGLAMRWPVFAAIVPELVPRAQLPAALALNGIAMNASRIVGPIVAGALIAGAGSAYVFGLNALLSIAAAVAIWRWRREAKPGSALPGERFVGAMRVGVQYVRQSPRMRAALLRVAVFFLQSTGLLALLPLVARRLQGGDAGTFTLLLAAMGTGAIGAALFMPRLRDILPRETLLRYGSAGAGSGNRERGAGAERLGRRHGDALRRCCVDHRREHTHRGGAARAARLGARARHVDLPDGIDGRLCAAAPRCGVRWRRGVTCRRACCCRQRSVRWRCGSRRDCGRSKPAARSRTT